KGKKEAAGLPHPRILSRKEPTRHQPAPRLALRVCHIADVLSILTDVRSREVADVQAALGSARKHNLSVSVRSGGYDWAGRSVRDGGFVIDLSAIRRGRLGAARRTSGRAGARALVGTEISLQRHR